jgi:NADH:ubiquinone oxidoreductase subunit 2 (subunit N)
MLFYNNFHDTLVISFSYLFVYNVSLFLMFWVLHQFVNLNFKTIYSFNDLKFNFHFTTSIAILLFSIAGVPPFIGFFSKLLILITLVNSDFFFFYIFFFILLFFGLYFYLQNIRFLYSTTNNKLSYSFQSNLRISSVFFYYTYFILFFIVFGFFFFDDIILYFYWILS